MKREISVLILALIFIFTVAVSGCTGLNSGQSSNNPQEVSVSQTNTPVETQAEIVQPTVSWKDFYPEHDEQEKSELIEKAKDEIMRLFPNVDRSTLNGVWVEHSRVNKNGYDEIGRPYINFENLEFSTGDSRPFVIEVDPELMKVIYYSPYSAQYNSPVISYKEAKEKAIEFIKNAQGEDSLAYDSDAYMVSSNNYETGGSGRPITVVEFCKKDGGVIYQNSNVIVEYDMSRDKVERYYDDVTDTRLLSGLTTLSPEPDITFDEAVQIFEDKLQMFFEDKLPEKYNVDDLGLEYSKTSDYDDSYLSWWDDDNVVYADDPSPIPLVWFVGCSDKDSRKNYEETGDSPEIGAFRIDAHTGEIYKLIYDQNIIINKYQD
jgi:hypothetical protein